MELAELWNSVESSMVLYILITSPNYSHNTPRNFQSDIWLWIFVSKCFCTFYSECQIYFCPQGSQLWDMRRRRKDKFCVCVCVFLCVCCSCTTLTKQGTSSQDNGLKEKVVWPFVTRGGVGTDVAATEREIRLRLTSQSQSLKTHFYYLKV